MKQFIIHHFRISVKMNYLLKMVGQCPVYTKRTLEISIQCDPGTYEVTYT